MSKVAEPRKRLRRVRLFVREVARIREGRQSFFLVSVRPCNSTVLGYRGKELWAGLHFEAAERRRNSLITVISGVDCGDIHLAVPWRHLSDEKMPLPGCGKYAVRPIWEVGERLHVIGERNLDLEILSIVPELHDVGWRWLVVFYAHTKSLPRECGC